MAPITARLATFAAETRWQDLPAGIVHEAKRSLLNYFAVALGGCRDDAVEHSAAVFARFTGPVAATVIGRGERSDLRHASSLNAMAANVFDFDDTHVPTIIHPTAPVAPVLFALAEAAPMTGRDLLLAFVLGVEIECRLGNAVSPWHYQRGWHITATCGVFGAAAAAGRAIGLDATRIGWALGNASAQSSGLVETLGSMAKSIGVGNSAANGLLSALLAQQGFAGPAAPIEGPRGFLRVMGDAAGAAAPTPAMADATTDVLMADLGTRWELAKNTYKPYPCGVVLNPVLEACLALAAEAPVEVDRIERVELVGNPLLRERTDRPRPASGREAQVSAQHGIAVALASGRAGLAEFSDAAVADPASRRLADRVVFTDDPALTIDAVRLTLHLQDGSARHARVDAARGCLARPLSDADLERKLVALARHGDSGCDPRPLIDAVWALDRTDDAGALMALAAGHAGPPR